MAKRAVTLEQPTTNAVEQKQPETPATTNASEPKVEVENELEPKVEEKSEEEAKVEESSDAPDLTVEAKDKKPKNGRAKKKKNTQADESTRLGPYKIPSMNAKHALADEIPNTILRKQIIPNACGVSYDKEKDTCYHLNPGWKNGCCTIAGSSACPFLGGEQSHCEFFADKGPIMLMPIEERRKLTFGSFKLPEQRDRNGE
jgi:hypothetical protein